MKLVLCSESRSGAGAPINSLRFDLSGQYVFKAQKNSVLLVEPSAAQKEEEEEEEKKEELIRYSGHSRPVNAVSVLGNSGKMASSSNRILVHDSARPELGPLRTLHTQEPGTFQPEFQVNDVAGLDLGGDLLASADDLRKVCLFDLRQQNYYRPVQEYQDAADCVNSICFDTAGKNLVAGASDGCLRTYDLRNGVAHVDALNSGAITRVACTGHKVGANVLGRGAVVLDLRTGAVIAENRKTYSEKTAADGDSTYKTGLCWISPGARAGVSDRHSRDPVLLAGSEHGKLYLGSNPAETVAVAADSVVLTSADSFRGKVCVGTSEGVLKLYTVV